MSKKEYFKEIIKEIKKRKLTKDKLSRLKVKFCRKHGLVKPPTDIEILLNAKIKDVPKIKSLLQTKPVRSASGVSVVAIMTKAIKCPHGACSMCSSMVEDGIPQSYTGKEPATRRAIRNCFDPYLQVFNRIEQYVVTGHSFDKVELIVMGGTFPSFPKKYKETFITYAFKAMNDFSKLFFKKNKFNFAKFKKFFELPGEVGDPKRTKSIHKKLREIKNKTKTSLKKEHAYNDKKSRIKCIGMTIETRSDYGKLKEGNELLDLGCTRIELGIQSVYDKALKNINRGHTVQDNIDSIKVLKDLGFKLNFHYMPGLPGISKNKDLQGMLDLFDNENYRPDMLKIYPCMVIKKSKLYESWKKGKFKPLTTKQAAKMIAHFKYFVPPYCRIMRVQRDIPTYATEAGVDMTNLRQVIQKIMEKEGIKCECIRCREIGRNKTPKGKKSLNVMHYGSSQGNEFFISADIGNCIIGFCRLRFPSQFKRKEITESSALIRELHVYGPAVAIGKKGTKKKIQHTGVGKALLEKAEEICKMYYKDKIVIISGVGVRGYYRKIGYKQEGPYMVKKLK